MSADSLPVALALAAVAGMAIPLGGLVAALVHIRAEGRRLAFRHTIMAFGGGALLSAVALVLVPDGIRHQPPWAALLWLGLGGVVFMVLDRALKARGGGVAQLLAMMLDFLPEAMALGAILASDATRAKLLALLIALQNLPEGFNAFREMRAAHGIGKLPLLLIFVGLAMLGPAAAAVGTLVLEPHPKVLGALMLFAGGGILYLMFQDIAPQVPLDQHWLPPLGAVGGFMLGLAGYLYIV